MSKGSLLGYYEDSKEQSLQSAKNQAGAYHDLSKRKPLPAPLSHIHDLSPDFIGSSFKRPHHQTSRTISATTACAPAPPRLHRRRLALGRPSSLPSSLRATAQVTLTTPKSHHITPLLETLSRSQVSHDQEASTPSSPGDATISAHVLDRPHRTPSRPGTFPLRACGLAPPSAWQALLRATLPLSFSRRSAWPPEHLDHTRSCLRPSRGSTSSLALIPLPY